MGVVVTMSSTHKRGGSRLSRYGIKAQMAITNTKSTIEPSDIQAAKASLKSTKQLTIQMESISKNLYYVQNTKSRIISQLCDALKQATIANSEDRMGIFLNNMGRISQNIEDSYQMYLLNMLDQLITPLHDFNQTQIKNCQDIKLQLKTKKGQYDIKKKQEEKILSSQSQKNVNLEKVHLARSKSAIKLDDLQSIRNEFIASVNSMEQEKLSLLSSFQSYMGSYAGYVLRVYTTECVFFLKIVFYVTAHAKITGECLKATDKMNLIPPNWNNKYGLDSDTEDINDNDGTMSKYGDWGQSNLVVRCGWIRKRGKVNKSFKRRYFKLYTNRKLIYLNGPNGKVKGHINLMSIVNIKKSDDNTIDIQTKSRLWTLQFEESMDRDGWFNAFMETKGVTLIQTAESFDGDQLLDAANADGDDAASLVIPGTNQYLLPPVYNEYSAESKTETEQVVVEEEEDGDGATMTTMPPPGMYSDYEVDDVGSYNPFESDSDEKDEINGMESAFITPRGADIGVDAEFIIVVEGVALYNDENLSNECFDIQIKKGDIVNAQYVNPKVIFIKNVEKFVSVMDVVEVPGGI